GEVGRHGPGASLLQQVQRFAGRSAQQQGGSGVEGAGGTTGVGGRRTQDGADQFRSGAVERFDFRVAGVEQRFVRCRSVQDGIEQFRGERQELFTAQEGAADELQLQLPAGRRVAGLFECPVQQLRGLVDVVFFKGAPCFSVHVMVNEYSSACTYALKRALD